MQQVTYLAHIFHARYRFVNALFRPTSGKLEHMRRSISLRAQLLMWQLGIVLFVVATTMATAVALQWMQLRDAYVERALGIAHAVAELPNVKEAFEHNSPAQSIQPIAELIREASGMTYVVVTDAEGIRYSHPNPDRIGEKVSTDPSVALSGEVFTGLERGTLGETWRAKVPVYDETGAVIGQVSVGILDSELRHDVLEGAPWQIAIAVLVAAVSVIGALLTVRIFRKRTLGLEPEQIAGLLEGREAILHGSRDGLFAVDTDSRVVLINDAALEFLSLESEAELLGAPASDVLDAHLASQLEAADGEERLVLFGERTVLVRADPVAHLGEPAGTVVIMRDHTELHETIAELEGAQTTTDRLRSQAHAFQNQLHVIGGLIRVGDVEAAAAFVDRVSRGGELPLLDAPGSVDAELGALLLAKNGEARESGVRLEYERLELWPGVDEAPLELRDDILTIVGNVLDNALEATGPSDVIRLTVDRVFSALRITVEDSGPGVPAEMRDRIFEAGVTTKSNGHARGFGLPLVKSITRRLGGEVSVHESELGGARFTVTVPFDGSHLVDRGGSARTARSDA